MTMLLLMLAALASPEVPTQPCYPSNPTGLVCEARDTRRGPADAVPRLVGGRGLDSLVSYMDYPDAALRAGEQGDVELQLVVAPEGRVISCTVLKSSGSPVLDSSSCRLLVRRARFWPALDNESRPIASTVRHVLKWRMWASPARQGT
jgi:TonB family protein